MLAHSQYGTTGTTLAQMVPVVGLQRTKLVVGRGRLFFDPFKDGTRERTGEQYLGNTPAFNITRSVETASRLRSVGGRKIKSAPVIVSESFTASFTTDNISYFNVANWFGAQADEKLLYGSTFTADLVAFGGRIYDVADFIAIANESNRIIKLQATALGRKISIERNFDTSGFHFGRFSLRPDARDLFDGDAFTITVTLQERRVVDIIPKNEPIFGALRYQSHNIRGDDVEYVYPSVMLTCSGSVDLKSDDFQQLSFDVEAYKLAVNVPFQFLKILPHPTRDEQAILDNLTTIAEFPLLEEKLNKLMQQDLPVDFKPWPIYNWIIPSVSIEDFENSNQNPGLDKMMQRDLPRMLAVDVSSWLGPVAPDLELSESSLALENLMQYEMPETINSYNIEG